MKRTKSNSKKQTRKPLRAKVEAPGHKHISSDPIMQKMALEIIAGSGYLHVHKRILCEYGPSVTIFLSHIVDKFLYFDGNTKLQSDGSFFLRHKDMSTQTGMNDYELRKCKKTLKEQGIISTIMKGLPQKEFYFLHLDKLVEEYQRINPLNFKGLKLENLKDYNNNRYNNNRFNGNTKVLPSVPSSLSSPADSSETSEQLACSKERKKDKESNIIPDNISNMDKINKILNYWFNLSNTIQHKQSSKVYKQSIQVIENLLSGLPIQHTKNGLPYKNLQAFCSKHRIDPELLSKKWPINQIKKIMRSIHAHLSESSSNKISLDSIFWNNFANNGGWSWFLFKASENSVPKQFQGMAVKLSQAVEQNLTEAKQMSWARDFQLLCDASPANEVDEVLDWYMQNYDYQYVKSVISCKDFCQFYKNIKKSMVSQYNNKSSKNRSGTRAMQSQEVTDSIKYPKGRDFNPEGDSE